jgi:hypothetical protein
MAGILPLRSYLLGDLIALIASRLRLQQQWPMYSGQQEEFQWQRRESELNPPSVVSFFLSENMLQQPLLIERLTQWRSTSR